MRAVRIHEFGGPDKLLIDNVDKPVPHGDQILVRVAAAGINPIDWKIREGYLQSVVPMALPITLGNEVAGTIEALGPDAKAFQPGERVHGAVGMTGGLAQYALLSSTNAALIPDELSFETAAALPVAAATALTAIEAAALKSGTRVLVHAAAGSVGGVFIQLAKRQGATVIALTSPSTREYVSRLGADVVIDRTTAWREGVDPVDVVFDAFGLPAQNMSWNVLKPGGILLSIAHPPSEADAITHGVKSAMVFGMPNGEKLAAVSRLVAEGAISVRIDTSYELETAVEGFVRSQSGKAVGKLIVNIGA